MVFVDTGVQTGAFKFVQESTTTVCPAAQVTLNPNCPSCTPKRPSSDASGNHAGDPANAGIRREPELPEQEEIVPPPPAPVQEFDLLDDEPDVDAAQARAIRQRMRMVARQVAMNPDDGINL